MDHFHGIHLTPTSGPERDNLGPWKGTIEINGYEFMIRPDGEGGALLNTAGCAQIDRHDDGTRALTCDASGVVSGVAGRVGQIVGGRFVARPEWTREDLGLPALEPSITNDDIRALLDRAIAAGEAGEATAAIAYAALYADPGVRVAVSLAEGMTREEARAACAAEIAAERWRARS